MNKPRLLHVGYMKTATTYLQSSLFADPASGFGRPGERQSGAHIVSEIILSDGFTFDAARTIEKLARLEDPVRDAGLVPVWSEETFLGEPVSRRYDAYINAVRLHQVMPDAKVLITIREQHALALSMYYEHVRQGGTAPLRAFTGTGQEKLSFTPILREEYLLYDRAIEFYQRLFGKENVLVLAQEQLRAAPKAFLHTLADFVGLDPVEHLNERHPHRSMGAFANGAVRLSNRFFAQNPLRPSGPRAQQFLARGLRVMDRMTPGVLNKLVRDQSMTHIRNRYQGRFTESNARTAQLTGLDLPALGYS